MAVQAAAIASIDIPADSMMPVLLIEFVQINLKPMNRSVWHTVRVYNDCATTMRHERNTNVPPTQHLHNFCEASMRHRKADVTTVCNQYAARCGPKSKH